MTDRDERPESGRFERKERREGQQDDRRPRYENKREGGDKRDFRRDDNRRPSREDRGNSRERRDYRRDDSRPAPRDGARRDGPRPDGARRDTTGRNPAERENFGREKDKREFSRDNARPGSFGDRGKRPFRSGPHPRDLDAIRDLDDEILRLIVRRAGLIEKISTKGRLNADTEKELRQAWERKATRLSKDKRLGRELFTLLQGVDPTAGAYADEKTAYNLSPAAKPVEIALPAPANPWLARCWMAMAAATGSEITLSGLTITKTLLDAVKAINVLGGKLWWEDDGRILNKGGKGLIPNTDNVVHLGADEDSLWFLLAFALSVPTRMKIMARHDLDGLDLSPLSHFLPQLGARLTNVIPGQDGLPVRLETSGIIPQDLHLPEDLPVNFVAALLLAAPFRDRGSRMHIPASVASVWFPRLVPIMGILDECGLAVSVNDNVIEVSGEDLQIPEQPQISVEVPLAATLLAMAALSKGTVKLQGQWPENGRQSELAGAILTSAGLSLSFSEGLIEGVRSDLPLAAPKNAIVEAVRKETPELLPLALVMVAAEARAGGSLTLPALRDETAPADQNALIEDFLAQVGLELAKDGTVRPQENAVWPAPWLSPSPVWAMGLALEAFLRPNLRLVNPGVMNQCYPDFWKLYNSLPHPDMTTPTEVQDDKPIRRRIIARGVYGELPPDPPARDDD